MTGWIHMGLAALAAFGAKVAILDLAGEKAQEIADEICAEGGRAIGVKVNVLEAESVA